jgi:hypothetical protein
MLIINLINYSYDTGGPLYVLDKIGNKTKFVTSGIVSYGTGCARQNISG